MGKLRRIMFVMVFFGCLFVGSMPEVNTYVEKGCKLSDPKNINFGINASAGRYAGIIPPYAKTWGTYCSEIGFSSNASQNVFFSASTDCHSITFYKSFETTTAARKNETIVHEMGHVLGLDHCQTSKNSISVMRKTGFNGKAYPLSDDISGISAIY